MSDQTKTLQQAVTTILRALKIAETQVQVAHRELSFMPADIQTLRYLSQNNGCKLSDLAGHLGVVPTTASSIVDRLVERGFVGRERPASNRRAVALHLTEDGSVAFGRIEAEEMATMRIMLDALPEADRTGFVEAMTRIAAHVAKERNL